MLLELGIQSLGTNNPGEILSIAYAFMTRVKNIFYSPFCCAEKPKEAREGELAFALTKTYLQLHWSRIE